MLKKTINFFNSFIFFIGFLSLAFFGITIFNASISDSDLWLHLASGRYILENKSIPHQDIFSFTRKNFPWIDHEWLFQIIVYLVFKNFSFSGLVFLKSFVFTLTLAIIILATYKKETRFLLLISLFLFIGTTINRPTLRADLFSLLFSSIFLSILYKKKKSLYFLLPILEVIWTNIHGFFFLGYLIILFFLFEEKDKYLKKIFFLTLLASLFNPYFLKGAFYPFYVFKNMIKSSVFLKNIVELQSPFKVKFISVKFYKIILVLVFISFFFQKPKISSISLILFFFLFSFSAVRNIHFFALASVYVLLENSNFFKKLKESAKNFGNYLFTFIVITGVFRFSAPFYFNVSYILTENNQLLPHYYFSSLQKEIFPFSAVEFLKNLQNKRLFNDFNSGAFLCFYSPNKFGVFIDGRTEFYGYRFLKDYDEAMNGNEAVLKKLVRFYKLDGFFISYRSIDNAGNLIKLLYKKKEYKVVYFGPDAIIFLKDDERNKEILKKYSINLEKWKPQKIDLWSLKLKRVVPLSSILRLKVLDMLNLEKPAVLQAKEIIRVNPSFAFAWRVLGKVSFYKKDWEHAYEYLYKAFTLGLKDKEVFSFLIKIYIKKERFKEAKELFSLAKKSYPYSKEFKSFKKFLR